MCRNRSIVIDLVVSSARVPIINVIIRRLIIIIIVINVIVIVIIIIIIIITCLRPSQIKTGLSVLTRKGKKTIACYKLQL